MPMSAKLQKTWNPRRVRVESIGFKNIEEAEGFALATLNTGYTTEFVCVYVATLRAGSTIPKHPAGRAQVFYVVSGEGRVSGDDDVEQSVGAGSVVTWSPGEYHTTSADSDMTVVIVQRKPAD